MTSSCQSQSLAFAEQVSMETGSLPERKPASKMRAKIRAMTTILTRPSGPEITSY